MKCTNRKGNRKRNILLATVALLLTFLSGCQKEPLVMDYKSTIVQGNTLTYESLSTSRFAMELCVTAEDVIPNDTILFDSPAGLFDIGNKKVLYANKIHEKMYPASLTKVMTALVLLQHYHGDFSDTITVGDNIRFNETGVQLCGFKKGDVVYLDQLLHGLLIYSGNDAALIIGEYIAGTNQEFVDIMNKKATALGATNTNFTNNHGLHQENHYTSAYDMYLIFQEALKYEKFREVIQKSTYTCEYKDSQNKSKSTTWNSTNLFITGEKKLSEKIEILGGKTGTTNAAGSCLITLARDDNEQEYISIIMKEKDKTDLYENMDKLLNTVLK